jgi:hypothetical protein
MVPSSVTADLRQKLNSNNPSDVAMGLQQSAALYDATPAAFDASDNGAEVREAATTYNELVNTKGLSAEQAAQRLIDQRAPENVAKAKVLDDRWKAKETQKAINVGDLLAKFDDTPNVFSDTPRAGINEAQVAALESVYAETVERHFKGDANGDLELAKAKTFEEMDDTYGVSRTSGDPIFMAHNPEKFYKPLPASGEPGAPENHDWLRDMALNFVRESAPTADRVMLMSDPTFTPEDVRAGRPPRYRAWYRDAATGAWNLDADAFSVSPQEMTAVESAIADQRRLATDLIIARDEATRLAGEAMITSSDPFGRTVSIPNPNADPAALAEAQGRVTALEGQVSTAGAQRATALGASPNVITPPSNGSGGIDAGALSVQQQLLQERGQQFGLGNLLSPNVPVFDPSRGGIR